MRGKASEPGRLMGVAGARVQEDTGLPAVVVKAEEGEARAWVLLFFNKISSYFRRRLWCENHGQRGRV